jgi:hypothetical protein
MVHQAQLVPNINKKVIKLYSPDGDDVNTVFLSSIHDVVEQHLKHVGDFYYVNFKNKTQTEVNKESYDLVKELLFKDCEYVN